MPITLMTNRVPLPITPTTEPGAARLMKGLGFRYVRYVNCVYGRTGTLFEGRFRSSLIKGDRYLLACRRYIELNPVRAGLAADPGAYPELRRQCPRRTGCVADPAPAVCGSGRNRRGASCRLPESIRRGARPRPAERDPYRDERRVCLGRRALPAGDRGHARAPDLARPTGATASSGARSGANGAPDLKKKSFSVPISVSAISAPEFGIRPLAPTPSARFDCPRGLTPHSRSTRPRCGAVRRALAHRRYAVAR